ASTLVQYRTTRPLQTARSGVGIHSYHKSISLSASAAQIPHVSYVQDVKAPVREYNFLALLTQFLRNPRQILSLNQFCGGLSHVSASTAGHFSVNRSKQLASRHNSSATFHHDEAARHVCNLRSFERRSSRRHRQRIRCQHRVAGTGDVDRLVTSVYRNQRR